MCRLLQAYIVPARTFLSIPFPIPYIMATIPKSLPDSLRTALSFRADAVCPADVEAALSSIPFFRIRKQPMRPMGAIGGASVHGGWRGQPAPTSVLEDGFQTVMGRRGGAGAGGQRRDGGAFSTRRNTIHHEPVGPVAESAATVSPPVTESAPARFSAAAVKTTAVDMEDRILARVKGKINKIGPSTFEATKAFMQQILDGDETDFLDEFMKFVFQKAATESTFCPLYARLLHELADEFGHLRTVMVKLFTDYTAIFTEFESAPDVGTEDYRAFVEAQERKKFRRGYSQFVAELVKLGEADKTAFLGLINQILCVLESSYNNPDRNLMCEEYVDCLTHMCYSASTLLRGDATIQPRVSALTKRPRSETPGLTNKGRFALMDLVDFAERGWTRA